MAETLNADDWIKQGLKALARDGFTALKADPLAKAMGVSRGSFYWHFADLGAFHAALLKRWREIAAEQIIADVEADSDDPLKALLRRTFGARLDLERAVRNWAAFDAAAQTAVRAIDRRRLDYIEELLKKRGFEAATARARAQILYWTFLASPCRARHRPPRGSRACSTRSCGWFPLEATRWAPAIFHARGNRPPEIHMNAPTERPEASVDPKLLEILVCPLTKGPLEFDSAKQELISRSAKLAYPIRDGIPIMLPEEARKID